MSESRCEDCHTPYRRTGTLQFRCSDCQAIRARLLKFEATERARHDSRRTCRACGVVRLGKGEWLCEPCATAKNPNYLKQLEYRRRQERKAKPRGVWRLGPIVFDWSGESSAWRCDEHPGHAGISFDLPIDRALIKHARVWHNTSLAGAVEINERSQERNAA